MKNKYLLAAFQGKNDFWRYFVVMLIIFLATQLASIPYVTIAGAKAMAKGVHLTPENLSNFELLGINSNFGLFLLLLSFVVGFFLIILLIEPFHKRSIKTTLTSRDKFDWNRFFFAVLLWGSLMIISFIISYLFNPQNVHFQFNKQQFFILVIIAISCVSLQSAFEEIVFRGYLLQGFTTLTKNAWFPLVITSVIFGLMHAMNPEVKEFGFGIMIPQYIILGLFLAIMTIMDEGLELAIGVHVANNVFSALMATHESSVLQTDALFRIETIDPVSSLYEIIIVSVIVIGIMAYKYKWGSFKKLYAKVKPH